MEPQVVQNTPTPEDLAFVENFREQVERDYGEYRKNRRQFWKKFAWMFVLNIIGAVIALVIVSRLFGDTFSNVILCFLSLIGWGWSVGEISELSRSNALKTIERARDSRLAGVLIEMTQHSDRKLRDSALHALRYVLPQVRASDAPYISDRNMLALIGMLNDTPDVSLALAVLKVLSQIGDERAIPVVKKLSADLWIRPSAYLTKHTAELVQEAAKECLPTLISRSEQAKLRKTLLRATASPDDESGALLRPAALSLEKPEQLLRVGDVPASRNTQD